MERDELRRLAQQIPEAKIDEAVQRLKDLVDGDRFVFGVDLDGVVADYYTGLKPIAAEWLGVNVKKLPDEVSYGLPEWNMEAAPGGYPALHRFAVKERNLFMGLKPMKDAPQVLRRLSEAGVRIRIITHRLYIKHFHRAAIDQTVEWLDTHDIPYWDLCFMQNKAAVGADLYIDDSIKNIDDLMADGLDTIIFTNSTNRGHVGLRADSWQDVERIVTQKMAAWKKQRGAKKALAGR
jgi:5'(3')-deoxyribonucleotidase